MRIPECDYDCERCDLDCEIVLTEVIEITEEEVCDGENCRIDAGICDHEFACLRGWIY